jgi:sugar O-acyltransferase (sialic acid O-acetyltransferase NeuD family)
MSPVVEIERSLIMLGGGGHAKVLLALATSVGHVITGVCDPRLVSAGVREWRGLPILGDDEVLTSMNPDSHGLINGLGQMPGQDSRQRLYERWRSNGFSFPALVHPFSWVAKDVKLADGAQVMAGVVIQPDCDIGANSTVNTGANVDHDTMIGAHVHIAPAAVLCGHVTIGDGTFVGPGATVGQGIRVGKGAVLAAGVACVRNVADAEVIMPAQIRRALKQLKA